MLAMIAGQRKRFLACHDLRCLDLPLGLADPGTTRQGVQWVAE